MASTATVAAALAPGVASALGCRDRAGEAGASTISTTPARHSNAYSSRNGNVNTAAKPSTKGSEPTPISVGHGATPPPHFDMAAPQRFAKHLPSVGCTDGIDSKLGLTPKTPPSVTVYTFPL